MTGIIGSFLIFGTGFFIGAIALSLACASKKGDEQAYAVPRGYSEDYVRSLRQQLIESESTVSTLRNAYQNLTRQHQDLYETTLKIDSPKTN